VNYEEVGKVLAVCAVYDMREVDETDIVGWHELLKDMDFQVARQRVLGWYSTHRDRIMPSDILHSDWANPDLSDTALFTALAHRVRLFAESAPSQGPDTNWAEEPG
jgi:hypothetical protein